jgi:hypothetical protein
MIIWEHFLLFGSIHKSIQQKLQYIINHLKTYDDQNRRSLPGKWYKPHGITLIKERFHQVTQVNFVHNSYHLNSYRSGFSNQSNYNKSLWLICILISFSFRFLFFNTLHSSMCKVMGAKEIHI